MRPSYGTKEHKSHGHKKNLTSFRWSGDQCMEPSISHMTLREKKYSYKQVKPLQYLQSMLNPQHYTTDDSCKKKFRTNISSSLQKKKHPFPKLHSSFSSKWSQTWFRECERRTSYHSSHTHKLQGQKTKLKPRNLMVNSKLSWLEGSPKEGKLGVPHCWLLTFIYSLTWHDPYGHG